MAFGDPEVFDFLLSAVLNAVRTVDYPLRHEQRTYPDWRDKTWNVANPMEDSRLQFLSSDRRVEVHESGSARVEQWKTSKVAPGDTYATKALGRAQPDGGGLHSSASITRTRSANGTEFRPARCVPAHVARLVPAFAKSCRREVEKRNRALGHSHASMRLARPRPPHGTRAGSRV